MSCLGIIVSLHAVYVHSVDTDTCTCVHVRMCNVHMYMCTGQSMYEQGLFLNYPTVHACADGITNLHTSSVWYRGTAQSLCSWCATTYTTWTLLKHQALTPRTPWAIGSPLVPDPDQVSKHASLIPRPRV